MSDATKRSPRFDLVSFIAGVITAVLCLVVALGGLDAPADGSRLLGSLVLLGVGAGLLVTVRR